MTEYFNFRKVVVRQTAARARKLTQAIAEAKAQGKSVTCIMYAGHKYTEVFSNPLHKTSHKFGGKYQPGPEDNPYFTPGKLEAFSVSGVAEIVIE